MPVHHFLHSSRKGWTLPAVLYFGKQPTTCYCCSGAYTVVLPITWKLEKAHSHRKEYTRLVISSIEAEHRHD